MAVFTGNSGTVTWTGYGLGTVAIVTDWSASFDFGNLKWFQFGTKGQKSIPGPYVTSGSLSGVMDGASIFLLSSLALTMPAAGAAMVLTATTGRTYSFTACVENVSPKVAANGDQSFACSFTGDGEVTEL